MAHNRRLQRLILITAPLSVFLTAVYIALSLGVEVRPWWERAWGLLAGGSLGAVVGIGFFLFVGAIGWVSGPLFGAVGLLGLAAGGALGGLGLGSIVDIIRSPKNYNFHVLPILATLAIGLLAAYFVYVFLLRKFWAVDSIGAFQQSDHDV